MDDDAGVGQGQKPIVEPMGEQSIDLDVRKKAGQQDKREIRLSETEFLQANAPYIAQIGQVVYQQSSGGGHDGRAYQRPFRAAAVGEVEIRRIAAVFTQPPGYDGAAAQLGQEHLVILQGRSHIGKRATAVHLAINLFGPELNLQLLSPEIDLEQLESENLTAQRVFLVDGLLATRAEGLKELTWQALSSTLKQKQSYLIICARPEVSFPPDLPRGAVQMMDAPQKEPAYLVQQHLRHEGVEMAEIENWLKMSEVAALLQRPLLPPEAYELAQCLLPCIQDGAELQQSLQGFFAYAATAVEEWFDDCEGNIAEQCFRIALAVFNGARYEEVRAAANALASRFPPPPEPETAEKPKIKAERPSPFGMKRTSQLEKAQAYLTKAFVRTHYSERTEVEVVRLRNESYQPAFLRYLWEMYPDFRPDLMAWLSSYGNHPLADMRSRAAAAASFLAVLDFETIRANILAPWAKQAFVEGDRRYRTALNDVFGALIWDDNRANEVLGLLRHWMDQENIALVWAAARAYIRIGIRFPHEAMSQWQTLFARLFENLKISAALTLVYRPEQGRLFDLSRLFDSLQDAVLTFLLTPLAWSTEQFQQVYQQLLASLREWVNQENQPTFAYFTGLPLFLILTSLRLPVDHSGVAAVVTADDEEKYPPALLVLADAYELNDPCLHNLGWLLSEALRHKPTRAESMHQLQGWVRYVDQHDTLRPALLRTMQSLLQEPTFQGANDRWYGLLGLHLWRWSTLPRQPIQLAGKLLDELNLRRFLT